ncbi:Replicative DNA helicase [Paenibacillus sp. P1XP2]|nr:Replicative DNA helicase [Paenibacillus sp. P1XP2]
MEVFDRVEVLNQQGGTTTGIPTGFVDLDKMTNGFQRSDLIIVAARPSVGKTAFA